MLKTKTALNYQQKIIAMWTVFLLGTIFHTQIALMPLFHDLPVTESHTHEFMNLNYVFWFMMVFFILPMIAIVATAFVNSKRYRIVHFGLTVFYTVNNLLHFLLDIFVKVPGYQLLLMAFLFFLGLLLNLVSFQWMRERLHIHKQGEGLTA